MGLREVWRTNGRILLVAIILALQVATLGGTYMAVESLLHTRDSYYEELSFADLEVGFGLSPEFLAPTANPDVIFPAKGSLGIIYASRAQLDELFVDRLYNNLVFTYEPGQNEDAVKERILTELSALDIERIVPRRSN